ncbi:hypothetical protein KJ660_03165 [Candidatus Micrarchaeota archaeon]|nr:hypothetical protein [Candidatus Micrarchaeota archaeon]
MGKRLVLLIFLLLFSFSYAATVKETSFDKMGYSEDFYAEGEGKEECKEIIFFIEGELLREEEYFILSLHSEFLPIKKGKDAMIKVFLNEEEKAVKEVNAGEVKGEWIRIFLPKEKLKEDNKLRMCITASNTVTRIGVLRDSAIGVYKTAFFGEGDFRKSAFSIHPVVGSEVKVIVSLKNNGNAGTYVEIKEKEPLLKREDITFIRGESEFKGEVLPGEEARLEYFIKINDVKTRVLPAAEAYYVNEFGEHELIYSNYPEVIPVEPEALKPAILLQKPLNKLGEETKAVLVVKNNSVNPIYNLSVELIAPRELAFIEGEKSNVIEIIQPNEVKAIEFGFTSSQEGSYSLGCKASYSDVNLFEENCPAVNVVFEGEKPDVGFSVGIAMLLIGLIIYLYIYFR